MKKIFVLRALVLGDLIFILPALESLHAAYPQAEIVHAARPWAVDFLRGRIPWINRVIGIRSAPLDYEDLGFLIHPDDAQWFFPQMRDEHFDLAFSMQGGGKNSNPFIRRLDARISIGSREQGAIALDRWTAHDYYQNDVTRNLDLDMQVVLTGSTVDEDVTSRIASTMQEKPLNLSHQLSLSGLVGVLANAGLVVSNDTGVLHLALAVGANAVGLFWSEYISKSLPLSRVNFQPVIGWERHCPLCGMFLDTYEVVRSDPRACTHPVSFINSITPEEVMQAVQKVLLHSTEQAGLSSSSA